MCTTLSAHTVLALCVGCQTVSECVARVIGHVLRCAVVCVTVHTEAMRGLRAEAIRGRGRLGEHVDAELAALTKAHKLCLSISIAHNIAKCTAQTQCASEPTK